MKFIFQHNEIVEVLTVRSQTGDSSLLLVIKHTWIIYSEDTVLTPHSSLLMRSNENVSLRMTIPPSPLHWSWLTLSSQWTCKCSLFAEMIKGYKFSLNNLCSSTLWMSVSFIEKQGRSVMFTEEKIASTLHIHLLNFVGRIWTNMQIRIIYANDVNLELILLILDVKLDPERFIRPCL